MKRWTNLVFQTVALATQAVVPLLVKDPTKHVALSCAVAAAQGVVGVMAHGYNPDGTPAGTGSSREKGS
jgi:hypothetical protein